MTVQLDKNSDLVDILIQLDSKQELKDFLLGILTPKELQEISQRLEILRMLKMGLTHREIAETLGVGVATVTRGSKELQLGRFQYIKAKIA